MNRIFVVMRYILGIVFLVFGLDGVLHFVPLPPMPAAASGFIAALISTRLFYAIKAIEVASAIMLLTDRYTTLALCLLAPIVFNIVWFDAFLDPKSLPVGVLVATLELALLWRARRDIIPLLSPTPSSKPLDLELAPRGGTEGNPR